MAWNQEDLNYRGSVYIFFKRMKWIDLWLPCAMEISSFSSTFNTGLHVTNELLHSVHSTVPITKGTILTVFFPNSEQDGQCTYNVTFRRVLVTTVAVEKQLVLHILSVYVSSRSYAACKVHVTCCIVICGLSGSTMFFHISHKRSIFRKKKVIERKMYVLIFCTSFPNYFSF